MTPLDPPGDTLTLPMPGLEPDNLLAFIAMLGLLHALEAARADWEPRTSWKGPPWIAQLHLASFVEPMEIAQAANTGIAKLIEDFDIDHRKNVDFSPADSSFLCHSYARERGRSRPCLSVDGGVASEETRWSFGRRL
jgi:hypothetical protein